MSAKKRTASLWLSVILLAAVLIAGCAGQQGGGASNPGTPQNAGGSNESASNGGGNSGGDGKVVINVMRPGDQPKVEAWLEPAKEAFNRNNPDIELVPNYEGWGGWIQKYPTLFNANTQPEIVFYWDAKLKDATAADKIVPLEGIVDQAVLDAMPKEILDNYGRIDGELLYLPATVDPMMMYYRKDLFEQAGLDPDNPPRTWDELLHAVRTITEKTGKPGIGIPGKAGLEALHEFISMFVYQANGHGWLDENNKPIFNTPESLQAMELIGELAKYSQDGLTEYGRGELRPLFRDGEIGIIFESAWPIPLFQEKYGLDLDASPIGIVAPPQGPSGKVNWGATNGWIITRKDKAEAAGKVLSFLSTPEQLYKHHIAYGNAPIIDYELEQPEYQYDYWKRFNEVINTWKLIPQIGTYHPNPKGFYTELEPVWQSFLLGQIGPRETLDLAEEKAIQINRRAGIE